MPYECSRGEIPENGTLSQVENTLISARPVASLRFDDPSEWFGRLLPAFGFTVARHQPNGLEDCRAPAGTISEGQGRRTGLASYAGRIWTAGMAFDTFLAVLRVINEQPCSTITSD
jgi:hypothetical protein